MSQKHKKTLRPSSSGAPLSPQESATVKALIDGRHSKAALQLAKDLFKRCASPESESLLLLAYQARIDDLLKLGLSVEAKALLAIVRERFPAAAARLEDQDREICAIESKLETVVDALLDPNLPAANRESIETLIRRKTYDLPALAAVSSLPPKHPLREAASALATAFQAVTQGPVDDALLALPEVSHRSPLAPWKALVRAIASYHRREDSECRKWLQLIARDSLPARLIPSLHAMMGQRNSARCSTAETRLMAAAGDQGAVLRAALVALEEAFKIAKKARILDATRTAMAATHHLEKETRERLRQHIAVRAAMQHLNSSAVYAALGGKPRSDAYYFRLFARSVEEQRNAESTRNAAVIWEEFRRQAIKENWFAAGGMEDGVLSLHIAELMERMPSGIVVELREQDAFDSKRGDGTVNQALPSAWDLYARGCKADPSFEAFQKWLQWAAKGGPLPIADNVAEQWRNARPKDIQPLLYLMEAAEKRSAYQKSLKHLKEAEELDRLNPEVRRAKIRLLLRAAIRHLQQGKTRLAKAGIEQIETVPEVRPGEVAALAAALRWCCAALDQDLVDRLAQEANLKQSIGDAAGYLLITSLAKAGKMEAKAIPPPISHTPPAELLAGTVKACVLGQWAGLPVLLPRSWNDPLIAAQTTAGKKLPGSPLDAAQLLPLGEAALNSAAPRLAYAASAAGLSTGRANARFLFLRARCMPHFAFHRQQGCYLAALELARRDRDTDLAGKILDLLSGGYRGLPMPPELLSQILEEEQICKDIPLSASYCAPKYAAALASLDDSDDFDDNDFDDDEDEFDEDDFASHPPHLQSLKKAVETLLGELSPEAAEQIMRAMDSGEDPLTALDRIASKGFAQPAASSYKGKAAKTPSPAQGSLF